MRLAQGLLVNVQYSDGSRNFAKKMRALKIRSIVPAIKRWQQTTERTTH